jgi:thiosulfate dehydrogenase
MPIGTTWQQPVLSVEDSWDIAAFVKAHLDRDFPVRTEKPADAAYGPYLDGFSREQQGGAQG